MANLPLWDANIGCYWMDSSDHLQPCWPGAGVMWELKIGKLKCNKLWLLGRVCVAFVLGRLRGVCHPLEKEVYVLHSD